MLCSSSACLFIRARRIHTQLTHAAYTSRFHSGPTHARLALWAEQTDEAQFGTIIGGGNKRLILPKKTLDWTCLHVLIWSQLGKDSGVGWGVLYVSASHFPRIYRKSNFWADAREWIRRPKSEARYRHRDWRCTQIVYSFSIGQWKFKFIWKMLISNFK